MFKLFFIICCKRLILKKKKRRCVFILLRRSYSFIPQSFFCATAICGTVWNTSRFLKSFRASDFCSWATNFYVQLAWRASGQKVKLHHCNKNTWCIYKLKLKSVFHFNRIVLKRIVFLCFLSTRVVLMTSTQKKILRYGTLRYD